MSTIMPLGSSYMVNAQVGVNAALIKAGQTQLGGVMLHNAAASARWVRFYNKATAPVVGTDIPVCVVNLPAASSKELFLGEGFMFPLGLGISITAGVGYLDNSACALGDVQLTVDYI